MGFGKRSRLKGSGLLKNRNLFQKVPSQGRCVSARCKAVAAQAERYRALNEELIRENAALRAAEKSNREFSVMFDRFLLKMGQSIPYVQGMKKHLELAYDNLGQIETMVDCFTDANSLRKFLIGDESFMFEPVQTDVKDAPRSPLVKEAPPREHRRFDDEGEIETIMEQTVEDEENLAVNSPLRERSTFVKGASQCLETPAIPQRRSSRRSSIGIPRVTMERTHNKLSLDASTIRKSTNSSKSSQNDSSEKRMETPSELNPRSPKKRATYVKVPEPPQIIVSRPESSRKTVVIDKRKNRVIDEPEVAGKSDEELSQCFEKTVTETKLPSIELPQIHERSPTAVNVAQIWANANALRPVERSPTCPNVAALLRKPPNSIASMSIETSPALSSLLDPLATTQFPSPVLCEKESSLPTSTPAMNKAQKHPTTPPEVSIIVAETPEPEQTVVKNVDCRRRKPNLLNVRNSSPQFSSAIRKSVRFHSTMQDDSDIGDRTVTKSTVTKASVSSPFVKRVRNTRIRQTKAVELDRSDEGEENGTPNQAGRPEEAGTSSQPVPRRTYVRKKASAGPIGRKRSQRQSSKVDATQGVERQSNETGSTATPAEDVLDPPSPKRVRVTSGQAKEVPRSSSQQSRDASSLAEDTPASSRRTSRRTPGISYVEPSLRLKMRRD